MKQESKFKYNLKQFNIKNIWWTISLLLIILFTILYFLYYLVTKKWFTFESDKIGVLVAAICGTSGFFIAVTSFLLALNKSNPITKKFFESRHPKCMLYSCLLGMIFSLIALLTYLIFDCNIAVVYISLLAIGEIIVVLYYIFHLFKQYIVGEGDSQN